MIDVRLASAEDAEVVARLLLEAFAPFRDQYTPGGFADTTIGSDVVRERIATARVWLALDGTEPVGTVTALPEPEKIYIRSMAVTPRAQGRGIGQKLLEALEQDARRRGYKKLYLYTTFVLPGA